MQKIPSHASLNPDSYCIPSPPKPTNEAALDESYLKIPTIDNLDKIFFAYRLKKTPCSGDILRRHLQTYELNGMRFAYAEKSYTLSTETYPAPTFFIDPLLTKTEFPLVPWAFFCTRTGEHKWIKNMEIRPATLQELEQIQQKAMEKSIVFSSEIEDTKKVLQIVKQCIMNVQSQEDCSR